MFVVFEVQIIFYAQFLGIFIVCFYTTFYTSRFSGSSLGYCETES
jgi:hypothetical protein